MISNRIQSMHEIIIVFQKRNNDQIWKPVQRKKRALSIQGTNRALSIESKKKSGMMQQEESLRV